MRLLLTGASGQLGGYLLKALENAPEQVIAWSGRRTGSLFGHILQPMDLGDVQACVDAIAAIRPDVILHTAAMARVADCQRDPGKAFQINSDAVAAMCIWNRSFLHARFIHVSTDMVFDGEHAPYREEDAPAPLSVYGKSKAEAEKSVLCEPTNNVVVRLSLLEGPSVVGVPSFYDQQLDALQRGQPLKLFVDEWRTPLALADAAKALLAIARSSYSGLMHVGGPERLSRFEMGQRLAARLGVSDKNLVATLRNDVPGLEPRPRDLSLDSARYRMTFSS